MNENTAARIIQKRTRSILQRKKNKQNRAARTIQKKTKSILQRKKTALNRERSKTYGQKFYFDIQLEIISEMYNYDYNFIVHIGTNMYTSRLYQFINELKITKKPIVILFIYPIEYLQGRTCTWTQDGFHQIYSEFNKKHNNNIHITTIFSKLGNLDDKPTRLDIILNLLKSNFKTKNSIINDIQETNTQFSIPPRNMYTTIHKYGMHNNIKNKLNFNEIKLIKNINIISNKVLKNNNKVFFVNEAIFKLSSVPVIKINSCFSQVPYLLSIIRQLHKKYDNNVKLYERNSTTSKSSYKNMIPILDDNLIQYVFGTTLNKYVHNVNNTTNLLHIDFRSRT